MPKVKKTLGATLKKAGVKKQPQRPATVWQGPEDDGPQGGVTQSMLSRFLCCRERFRLLVVEGLKPAESFNHRIEYGQLWHICEEALAAGNDPNNTTDQWEPLKKYCQQLCRKYPTQQEQIQHWYNVCKVQFPLYVNFWSKHKDVIERTQLLQEQVFNVPYKLPSGRVVRLRGKWDAVDLIGKGKNAGIYLAEHKTKGDIDEQQIKRQLSFDLQTMLYLIALQEAKVTHVTEAGKALNVNGLNPGLGITKLFKLDQSAPIKGVRYNVVRRPLSGGKHSIRQNKPSKSNPSGESADEFYSRLGALIAEEPEHYFTRFRVEVTAADVEKFRRECLDPILEQLCDWWSCINGGQVSPYSSDYQNFRLPYGIYNPILEGRSTELDEYLASGSTVGLQNVNQLFSELQ